MQIIIIDSAEALARRMANHVGVFDVTEFQEFVDTMRPIEVPSDAWKLAKAIKDECFDPWEMNKAKGQYEGSFDTQRAAALIAAHSRAVPRAFDIITGKLEDAISGEDWSEAKSALNDLWDLREDIDQQFEIAVRDNHINALEDLILRMRTAGNMVREAVPGSVAIQNWVKICAEVDKALSVDERSNT